jgi:hypothetical protein
MLRLGQRDRQGESSSAYAMAVDLRSILELMGGGIFTMKRQRHGKEMDAGERGSG